MSRKTTRGLIAAAALAVGLATAPAATAAPATAAPHAAQSMAALLGTSTPAAAPATTIGDIYPAKWRNAPQDSIVDDWNMYNRECVSWNAYNIARHGKSAANYGNAKYWDDNARQNGFRVDNNPTVGSTAQTDAGQYGHVAIVDSVNGNTVTVEDYNWDGTGHYLQHNINKNDFRYIHFYS
ncbi:CHAP domain-containing protein [Amycolatopsis sp. PS_44_ISF1]|uniref:CHAP domain-containing protein n=1 Tax=Amycolatopsis sp. PS_44_ISF1 TaxID=2974917 RepID=UPI0028DEE5FC|nr:CHAP domain-containing protein [Amycolatopsis sp. PS_44_ISF1]MDT8914719.1 CHAP domain-containing protein [Amycolatopsis sp. PS_44_ISF1]